MNSIVRIFSFLGILSVCSMSYASMVKEQGVDIDDAVRRLDIHMAVLEQFNTKNKMFKLIPFKNGERFVIIDEVLDFSHDLLRICVKKMWAEESLDPMFVVWRLFVSEYKDIESETFLQEFGVLLFSIYKNIFVSYLSNRVAFVNNAPTATNSAINLQNLQQMIDLYNQVSALPLRQLLEALDLCLDQFLIIVRTYGLQEEMGWLAWIQQYWWVPPVVVTSFVLNLFKDYFSAPTPLPTVPPTMQTMVPPTLPTNTPLNL